MEMEELNKTQLILLALLLSFVTSIATGVVTVALMDQAPPGVTQTINRVVEKTVEVVQPGKETQVVVQEQVIVREKELISTAVQKNTESLVSFYKEEEDTVYELGSGFMATSDGLVVTDVDIAMEMSQNDVYGVYRGKTFSTRLVSYEDGNYVTIIKLDKTIDEEDGGISEEFFKPVTLSSDDNISLGSMVVGVDATEDISIAVGVITKLEKNKVKQEDGEIVLDGIRYIHTDMHMQTTTNGSPLILSDGSVAGSSFVSKEGKIFAVPSDAIKRMLDVIAQKGVETMIGEQSASVLGHDFKNIEVAEETKENID